ncbi:hypothetical protein CEXT_404651 [Caerostris extrusa]|uniref:Uncharacterized protein n=1 Tax=Caerostris extrusa TaxID=172846 RepID=A0AAV4TB60_CAEEX|nr:hypothetical protein CEXT_404651 [Caerostris extrusa]
MHINSGHETSESETSPGNREFLGSHKNSARIILDLATISSSEIGTGLSTLPFCPFPERWMGVGEGAHLPPTTRMSDNDFNFRIIPSPSRLAGFRKINRPLDRDYVTGICSLSPRQVRKAISFAHENAAPILQQYVKNCNVATILQEHWKELQCRTHSTRTLERTTMSHPFYKIIAKNYNVVPILQEYWKVRISESDQPFGTRYFQTFATKEATLSYPGLGFSKILVGAGV